MNRRLKGKIVTLYGSELNFAKAIKLHISVISKVIHGQRLLKPGEKERWAKILDADVEELFG